MLLGSQINVKLLEGMYPEILQRLDDSNNEIRCAAFETLNTFVKCATSKISMANLQNIKDSAPLNQAA